MYIYARRRVADKTHWTNMRADEWLTKRIGRICAPPPALIAAPLWRVSVARWGWTPSLRGPETHSLGATPFRGLAP